MNRALNLEQRCYIKVPKFLVFFPGLQGRQKQGWRGFPTEQHASTSLWLSIARFGLNHWLPQSSEKLIKPQTPTCLSHLWEYLLLNYSLLYVVYCWTKLKLECVFVFSDGGAPNFPSVCCAHSSFGGNFRPQGSQHNRLVYFIYSYILLATLISGHQICLILLWFACILLCL